MTHAPTWPTASDAAALIARLESLLGRAGVAEDYVRLRVELLRAQAGALDALAGDRPRVSAPRPGEGPPMVNVAAMPVVAAVARPLFGRVVGACAARAKEDSGLQRLERAVENGPGLLDELVRFAAVPEEGPYAGLAEWIDVPVEVLLLVSRVTAAPLVSDAARRTAAAGHSPPLSQGHCPACGAAPGLAELRPGDGARVLHCSLCGYTWPFGRLDCPACGGQDPAGVEKLGVEGDPARWLEVCRGCRRYLKTLDRRELPPHEPFYPLVEEVAGLYLDLLAEREGCLSAAPYAAAK